MAGIQGTFEIHITVDPADTFTLRLYCLQHKVKFILVVMPRSEGTPPSSITSFLQPMTSHHIACSSERDAIAEGVRIASDMANFRVANLAPIQVLRIKVESLARNEGVAEFATQSPKLYYEFHIKILDISTFEQLTALMDRCTSFRQQTDTRPLVSFSCKTELCPLLTLRIDASAGEEIALEARDTLILHLKSADITVGPIHSEFCVHDSNAKMDDAWING